MSDLTPFTDEEIHAKVDLLIPEWTFVNGRLKRTHECISFLEAINFINAIAQVAEQQKHHPVITIDYATIHLSLFTHDAPGITQKDFDLAQEIDTFLKK